MDKSNRQINATGLMTDESLPQQFTMEELDQRRRNLQIAIDALRAKVRAREKAD